MLDQRITTVFLSMALMAALVSLLTADNLSAFIWLAFIYFVVNKIRYFQGDIKLSDAFHKVSKESTDTEKLFSMFFGSTVLLLFVIVGINVIRLPQYYLFTAIALLADSLWLWLLITCIDEEKDTGAVTGKPIKKVIKSWFIINSVEMLLFIFMAIIEFARKDIQLNYPTLVDANVLDTTIFVFFACLFVILIIDITSNRKFLFTSVSE